MLIAIFSLGQFISSKLDVLKTGFQEWFTGQNKTVTGDEVWKWMLDNLAPLRLGKMSIEDFCQAFNTKFEVTMPFDVFKKTFNAMSTFDDATKAKLAELKEFLDENDHVKVILVSHTNYSHLDYIMEQLDNVVPGCRAGILTDEKKSLDDAKIFFATSMVSQSVDHPGTLKFAFEKLAIDDSYQLISFLNTIKEIPDFTVVYSDKWSDIKQIKEGISGLIATSQQAVSSSALP